MKYFIIAGEVSGEMHGSNLIRGIKLNDNKAQFRGIGGDQMEKDGMILIRHIRNLNFMGIWEVLVNLRTISKSIRQCKKEILGYDPDVIILIDYAGFNFKIAGFAKNNGYKVFYYISPKIWAWKKSRIKTIKKYVDTLYSILPFEEDFFKQFDYPVVYLGNPTVDVIKQKTEKKETFEAFIQRNKLEKRPIIALLAGSRYQEINRCLAEMLKVTVYYPEHQFVIAGAPTIEPEHYLKLIEDTNVKIVFDQTYQLLQQSEAAIVTSGTATLETALLNVPQVVIYKTSNFTYHVGKHFVHIKFFSLVNLIMDKEVVKELLQFDLAGNIKIELDKILFNKDHRQKMLANYTVLQNKIGNPGCSERVARHMVDSLNEKSGIMN